MVHHKEFNNAGKKPGLQVWRIEKMDLAPVPTEQYGSFFDGDSYIVLYTTSAPSYNVHTWFGQDTSMDERGAAAIFMTQLDTFLGGRPRQYTEYQNKETATFLGYFKHGIRYKTGGVASGFSHVVPNLENEKRLLQIKGRRPARAWEKPMSWNSFNKGDCFIIQLGEKIFIWSGTECNFYERVKTRELANDIRDNENNGRGTIEMIEEGSEPEIVIKELGPKPVIPAATSDEVCTEMPKKCAVALYEISDAAGSMTKKLVTDKTPFKQSLLSSSECYILDNGGNNNIYLWKGRAANTEERNAALNAAMQFIKEKNYPPNTPIEIFPEGSETTMFKHFFFNWLDKDETTGPSQPYTIGRIARVEQIPFDASTLHTNTAMAAQHGMVDDGSGKVQIYRIEGGDKKTVDPSKHGQFFGGDCYLVHYTYMVEGKAKHIVYIWQGQKCSKNELGASAILAIQLDDSLNGAATQVRVTQGQEPPHLVSLFKTKPLVIHLGGTSRESGESKPGSTRLFHIRRSSTEATRAVEVEPIASALNSNDVFVLKTPKSLFQWEGRGATSGEKTAAKYVAGLLGGTATVVAESKEPGDFWVSLGGKTEYQTSVALLMGISTPRLFGCSNKTGRLIAEEVPGDFTQLDLAPDDVMILDTGDQIYVWIGNEANEAEKAGSPKIAEEYLKSDPSGRTGIPICTFKQGNEPLSFTGWFHPWDFKLWEKGLMQCLQSAQ